MNIEDELRQSLAEQARAISASPGAWDQLRDREAHTGRRRRRAVLWSVVAAMVAAVVGISAVLANRPNGGTHIIASGRPQPAIVPATGPDLQLGPYGFLVPAGWVMRPLQNSGGPASFASFTDPGGQ